VVSGRTTDGVAGEDIVAGNLLYRDKTTPEVMRLAKSNGTYLQAEAVGIALNTAAEDQPVRAQIDGVIEMGTTLDIGASYYATSTAGTIGQAASRGDR